MTKINLYEDGTFDFVNQEDEEAFKKKHNLKRGNQ